MFKKGGGGGEEEKKREREKDGVAMMSQSNLSAMATEIQKTWLLVLLVYIRDT